jgi:YVTN family beta-propeller protein
MKKIILTLTTCCWLIVGLTNAQVTYKIANTFHIEGNEGWDYITADDSMPRLYVSHGSMVQVVDMTNGKVIGTINDLHGVHGITLARDLNKGFISSGKDSTVVVFELQNFTTLAKIKVTGANPDAIIYDRVTHRVFAFNGRSMSATVIDANTNKVIATIGLEGKPEFAVVDELGKLYVNLEDKSKFCVINTSTMKVENSYSIAPGEEPSGLAIDTKNHRLFMVCDNKMMVVADYQTGKVVTTVPIGEGPDGVSFDANLNRAYSFNGDGTLTVVQEVDANKFVVLTNVLTQKGARTGAVYQRNHHIYMPTAEYNPKPEPSKENPKPRATIKQGTFVVLDIVPSDGK